MNRWTVVRPAVYGPMGLVPGPGHEVEIEAETVDEENGTLVFSDADGRTLAVFAAGAWAFVRKAEARTAEAEAGPRPITGAISAAAAEVADQPA